MNPIARLIDRSMRRRARQLAARLAPHLQDGQDLLDLGCGTGHNAAALRARFPGLRIVEADVTDMKSHGPPPISVPSDGPLPFADASFDAAILLFVLHYAPHPAELLAEIARICSKQVIVIQSTYTGRFARELLSAREWALGRGALRFARAVGAAPGDPAALHPVRYFTNRELHEVFEASGLRVERVEPERWPLTRLSRDLFVLKIRR